ncbi:hypothetical protein CLOACE_07780 [Clostridium acetireducens DSM 10703]|uniref:DUF218 domain-containing protein n=1 Tax=Clostridium acetireducens DSM 10703 TaxID=1121290 RepID=A0A1E8F0V3_9CLOT|nr:YdcF family protein [Clostridium acetireducens]OFI06795.1 hypothetical protein CLOACE_07780 [Clostridium acetireducens DSM 10703]
MKSIKNKFFIFMGSLSIIYSIGLLIFNITFYWFWIALGILFIILGFIEFKSIKYNKFLNLVFLIAVALFIIIESGIIYNSFKKDKINCEYVIILGAGLKGDKMSLTLYQRMNESLQYINSHKNSKIILSGGKGKDEKISESEAMKKFLIQKGIKEDRIIKEENSKNTFENFKYSKAILKNLGEENKKVMVITSDFHMFRAKFLAKRIGIKVYGIPAKSHYLLFPNYCVREFFGFGKSFIFDK